MPFLSLLNREIQRFCKVIFQTVFTPIITASLYLLIFGVSLGASIEVAGGLEYMSFLIPGLVMMAVLNNSFQNSSSSVVAGKFSGDLEDLRVVPITAQQILWAMACGGLARGLIVGLITLIVGEIFHFIVLDTWLKIQHPGLFILFLVIGGLSFAKLGIAVAFIARTFDQLSAVGAFIITPLIYLGGVFFSLNGLHPIWQKISYLNPLLYFINGVRYGLVGISDVSWYKALIVSIFSLLLFHLAGLWGLKRGSYSRW